MINTKRCDQDKYLENNQEKYETTFEKKSCSFHLEKLIECIQDKKSNCDDLINNFIRCLDYKKKLL
jgi:hypothetical protein